MGVVEDRNCLPDLRDVSAGTCSDEAERQVAKQAMEALEGNGTVDEARRT